MRWKIYIQWSALRELDRVLNHTYNSLSDAPPISLLITSGMNLEEKSVAMMLYILSFASRMNAYEHVLFHYQIIQHLMFFGIITLLAFFFKQWILSKA